MNYRPNERREDKLLLSHGGKASEDFDTETSSRSGVSTKTPQKQSEKDKVVNNSGSTLAEEKSSEFLRSSDANQNTSYGSYLSRDISEIQDLYTSTTSSQWVSFDESNSTEHTTNDALTGGIQPSPGPTTASNDQGSSVSDIEWVQFKSTKENHTSNGINSKVKEDIVDYLPKESNNEQLEGNLRLKESSTNPFKNSELDRISSFSKSAKDVNGVPSKPIKSPSLTDGLNSHVDTATVPEHDEDDLNIPLPAYPVKPTNTTWSMFLRYPDIKQRIRGREWRPVIIKLNGTILQVYDEHDPSAPFREVSLQCFYDLTKPQLQNYHGNKVHTVKILYVKYKETNKLISKKNVQYVSKTTPILKLASPSHTVIREFIDVVRQAIRTLPIFRDRGISHNTEAVYINVHDTCSALIDASGSLLMLGILVRIYMRAFISDDPECELVLNDIHMKSQEQTRLQEELMPQRVHKWIKLEECDFHSTVSTNTYNQNRYIMLHPLDSCTFEVMQFRVRPVKPLPLLVKCELIAESHGRVELRAEVKLSSDPKLAKYERKNVCLYVPIPEAWVQLFMKEKRFRGEKSITSTNSHKAIKMRNRKNRPLTTIEVSTGNAKYEPEYKSIVWRINSLPLLNTTAPADSTHDFICHIQTMDSSSLPDDYKPTCVMEYDIPYTVASDTNIVNFKVSDKKIDTREVSYHTYYTYEIQMNMRNLNGGYYDR